MSACDDPNYERLSCPQCGRQVCIHRGDSDETECMCKTGCAFTAGEARTGWDSSEWVDEIGAERIDWRP